MRKNKRKSAGNILGTMALILPFIASCVAVGSHSLLAALTAVILIYVVVEVVPFCRGYENLWVFLLTATGLLPITVYLGYMISQWFVMGSVSWLGIVYFVEYFLILLSVEEVILGFAARRIWKHQRRLGL